jgi:hypothetical protein
MPRTANIYCDKDKIVSDVYLDSIYCNLKKKNVKLFIYLSPLEEINLVGYNIKIHNAASMIRD